MTRESQRVISSVGLIILLVGGVWLLGSMREETAPDEPTLPVSFSATSSTYRIDADVPATGNATLNRAVRRHVDARIGEFADMYAPERFTEEELQELGIGERYVYEQMLIGHPWEFGAITGMHVEEYQYTGGAHGGTAIWPFTFDIEGDPLTLRDLLTGTDYLERIRDAVRPRLREVLEKGEMYADEMFMTGTEASEGNYMLFTISDGGFTFYFNQYQVAPYAAGMPQVTVPLSELEGILSPVHF